MSGFTSLGKKLLGGGGGGGGLNSNASGPFGTSLVSNLTPASQGTFVYGTIANNPQWVTSSNGSGASVTVSEGIMTCTSGLSTSGSAYIGTNRSIKYRAGQGVICRLTSIFGSGATDTKQLAGIGNRESGYYFGRVGTGFGILHRESSKREIRSFAINAQGSVTVTVTLGGQSKSFAIVGGSNANQTSYLISQQDYSQVGSGWIAESFDGTVYFISNVPGPIGGTFSITVGGVSIVSSTSTVQAGVLPVETFISQSSWNIDTMDGNGASRISLDPSKGNIYGIGYQYLGFGDPVFSVENPETGLLTDVHRIQAANARTSLVIRNPTMQASWLAINSGSLATSVSLKGGSAGIFNEGLVVRNVGISFAADATKSSISSTVVPILSIRTNKVYNGQCNYGEIDVFNLSAGCDAGSAASNKFIKLYIYKNAVLGGPVNFQNVDSTRSIVSTDTAATSISSDSKTQFMKSIVIAANNSITLSLENENFSLMPGDVLTIAAVKAGSADVDAAIVSLAWFEDQ